VGIVMSGFLERVGFSLAVLSCCGCDNSKKPGGQDAQPETGGGDVSRETTAAQPDLGPDCALGDRQEVDGATPPTDANTEEPSGQDGGSVAIDVAEVQGASVDASSAKLVLSPSSPNLTSYVTGCEYPPVVTGDTTAVFTVTNIGDGDTFQLTFFTSGSYVESASTCPGHLAPGATCTISLHTDNTVYPEQSVRLGVSDGYVYVFEKATFTVVDTRVCLDGGLSAYDGGSSAYEGHAE